MTNETSASRKVGTEYLSYSFEAATAVSRVIFVAKAAFRLTSVAVNFETTSTSGTVRPRKITADVVAANAAAGATVLELTTAAISLSGVASTLVGGTLSATASDRIFKPGDKLALNFAGTLTGLVGCVVQLELQPLSKYGSS